MSSAAAIEFVINNTSLALRCLLNTSQVRKNWETFIINSVTEIIDNKPAVAQVYTPDGDFEFPHVSAKTWIKKYPEETYFLASSDSWKKSDISELTTLMQFELGQLWFQILNTKENDSAVDPLASYNSTFFKISNGEEPQTDIECIGNVADGEEIIWQNPNSNELEKVLPKLQEICTLNEFICKVVDERNK